MFMRTPKLLFAMPVVAVALLTGCATPPPPNPTAEVPYCHKTNKGRVIACTQAPAPSLNANAEAKRFIPGPYARTLYVVRRNWSDGGRLDVKADCGPAIEVLPNAMVRMKLKPGPHTVSFEFDGRPRSTTVQGQAGEVRFVRIDGAA